MSFRFNFQWLGEQWPSTYKGKNWADPANKAWTSFPWGDIKSNGPEVSFIKQLWRNYTNGKVWPMTEMITGNLFSTEKEKIKSDVGKFLFFDIFNLAPTLGEYRGYTKKSIPDIGGLSFFKSYKTPIEYKRTVKENGKDVEKKNWIYNGNISLSSDYKYSTFYDAPGREDASLKLRSVRFNTEDYYQKIINQVNNFSKEFDIYRGSSLINHDKMYYPVEEEYKLSWMRELVEYGVEVRMGPFAWKGQSKTQPIINTNGTYQFQIGNMQDLFTYRYSGYQYGYLYNWARMERDWARGLHTGKYGINEYYPSYKENKVWSLPALGPNWSQFISAPKAPEAMLNSLLDGKHKWSDSDLKIIHTLFDSRGNKIPPIGPDEEKGIIRPTTQPVNKSQTQPRFIAFTLGNSGKTKTDSLKHLEFYSEIIEKGDPNKKDYTLIGGIGIPPYFANDEDKKNFVVSGWLTVPAIFGDIALPWPFVWKYFGYIGFYEYSDVVGNYIRNVSFPKDIAEKFCDSIRADKAFYEKEKLLDDYNNRINLYNRVTEGDKTGNESRNLLRYNYRLKHWWYKYETKTIPDRELVFYLRMKYGVSHAVGLRYTSYTVQDKLFESISQLIAMTSIYTLEALYSLWEKLGGKYGTLLWLFGGVSPTVLIVFAQTNWKELYEELKKDFEVFNVNKERNMDSLASGGLPDGSNVYKFNGVDYTVDEYYKKSVKDAVERSTGKSDDWKNKWINIPSAHEKDSNGTKYILRSMYVSQAQDIVSWKRYNPLTQIPEKATIETAHTTLGQEYEVVKYKGDSVSGYYTFNGHGPDRFPIGYSQNYSLNYKSLSLADIKINDLAISKILVKEIENVDGSKRDTRDRFVGPEQLQSYNWKCVRVGCKGKEVVQGAAIDNEVEESNKVFYYDHTPINPPFSVSEDFNPALLSPKELQFVYEAVSFVLYGKTPVTEGRFTIPMFQWRNISNDFRKINRWSELRTIINAPIGKLNSSWINAYDDPNNPSSIYIPTVSQYSTVTLADYILWMAPTEDQYKKRKFSEYSKDAGFQDTFITRLYSGGANTVSEQPHYGKNRLKSSFPDLYPFHALADGIINSENSSTPLVPAFVHHRYISRKMNNDNKYYTDKSKTTLENRAINFMSIDNIISEDTDLSNKVKGSILRAMGGVNTSNKDNGILVTLPTFVLGGRPDLGEGLDSWDSEWGPCPFFENPVDKRLMVDNFDTVIDMWARGKKFKGKFVSAMEIMFWIRYRHGLAAAPSTKRVEHEIPIDKINPLVFTVPKTAIQNVWPPFLKDFEIINSEFKRESHHDDKNNASIVGEDELLPNEMLNYIEMPTSYYSPIIVDTYSFAVHDPLIELDTTPPNKEEYAALTGFNSYYGCHWPGAEPVVTVRKTPIISFNTYSNRTDMFVTSLYPGNSALRTDHSEHYYWIHYKYRQIERDKKTGYSITKDKSLLTGFDPNKEIEQCKRVILASDVQSWFRAYKTLQEIDRFSDYINRGLTLKEGEKDSVLAVQGIVKSITKDSDKNSVVHMYISGEGIQGEKINSFRKKRMLTFNERMRTRPWFERLESSQGLIQRQAVNLCDDYNFGTVGCIPQMVYLRHILMPNTFMYLTSKDEASKPGGLYTQEQVDKTLKAIYSTSLFWSKIGYETGTYFGEPDQETSDEATKTALPYSERISGLALQAITLSSELAKSKFSTSSKTSSKILSNREQMLVHYLIVNQQRQVWDQSAKIFFSVLSAIGGIGKFARIDDPSKPFTAITDMTYAAMTKKYKTLFAIANGAERFDNFANKTVLKNFKVFLTTLASGALGWTRPDGLPEFKDEKIFAGVWTSQEFKNIKPAITLLKEQVATALSKYLIKKAEQQLETDFALFLGRQAATRAVATRVIASEAAAGALGLTIASGGMALVITLAVAAVFYAIDRWQEEWELQKRYDKIWDLINEANTNGFLEGPYLQSEGEIIIKKTETGAIPILGKTYTVSTGNKENIPTSTEYKRKNLETMDANSLTEFVIKQNELFYEDDGRLDQILKDITKDSCECKFFKSIFQRQGNVDITNINDWNKGPYKRRFIDRENVIDEAPISSDIPIVYKRAQRPSGDVAWTFDAIRNTWGAAYGEVKSDAQISGKNNNKLIRDGQSDGRRASGDYLSCPRFWWPDTLIQASTNLCDYMAMDGEYPSAKPSYLRVCDPATDEGFSEHITRFKTERAYRPLISNPPAGEEESYTLSYLDKQGTPNLPVRARQDVVNNYFSRYNLRMTTETVGDAYNHNGKIPYYTVNSSIGIAAKVLPGILPHPAKYTYTVSNPNRYGNDYLGLGRITSEGLFGPAPPHEREIINLFRRKYKIDVVLPVKWIDKDFGSDDPTTEPSRDSLGRRANEIYNPYKDSRQKEILELVKSGKISTEKTTCCSMGEIISDTKKSAPWTGFNPDAPISVKKSEDEIKKEADDLAKRKSAASYCEYLISLNTENFRKKLESACGQIAEDRTDETNRLLTEETPVPQNPDPEPEDEKKKRRIPDCYAEDCADDPIPNDQPKQKNPKLPKCRNCDSKRTGLVALRKILPEMLDSSTLRTSWNLARIPVYFNGVILEWPRLPQPTSTGATGEDPMPPSPMQTPQDHFDQEPISGDCKCPPNTIDLGNCNCVDREIIFDQPDLP